MSLDISPVQFESSHGIGRLLYRQQGLLPKWGSIVALSTSDFAGDEIRLRSFGNGEAPWEEREFAIVALFAHEVEVIRSRSNGGPCHLYWCSWPFLGVPI